MRKLAGGSLSSKGKSRPPLHIREVVRPGKRLWDCLSLGFRVRVYHALGFRGLGIWVYGLACIVEWVAHIYETVRAGKRL